ncbi:MAG: D-alanyl-D-alanine carboxypeptidase family protein [Dehalococcoidia bacterium]|nr:D-alanyl-D-alanine carboxypeptidase family protein [Dehalococcoidia bacterium]
MADARNRWPVSARALTTAENNTNYAFLRLASILCIFSSLFSLGFGPPALIESDAARLPVRVQQLPQFAPVPPPKLTANAAVIMDFDSGRVLWEKNANLRVAPASTTKMMTGLLAMEQGRLSDKVTIDWKHLVGYASMGLWIGDVVTIEDLLWGMFLPSANEAAEAVADHVGGSEENFVKMMNDKAAELGLKNTRYMNPHGLDEEGHYSSAYDLAVTARAILQYPLINQMSATLERTIYASRPIRLVNSNTLLRMQDAAPGVDGFKTGYTGDAGNCLVATAARNGHRILTVVMGADNRNDDSVEILNYAFNNFVWTTLPTPATAAFLDETGIVHHFEMPAKRTLLIRPWEKWWISLNLSFDRHSLPGVPPISLGLASYSIAGSKVAEYPLKVKD